MPEVQENEAQALAIAHADGPLQVLAGPGSGKTYLTIRRIRHLICRHGVSPEKILVITFTKAAASEMEQRFRNLTDHQFPQVRFGTFHAVYYFMLKQSGYMNTGLQLVTVRDQKKYLTHIQKFFSLEPLGMDEQQLLLQKISAYKNNTECKNRLDESIEVRFQEIYREYHRLMQEEGRLDFDDMILLCDKMLEERPEILRRWQACYSHILVDEFQDISLLQYRIIRKLAEPEQNLFVVGDDDQSIYGFRGAGPDIMQRFFRDYHQARQLMLGMNYRCPERVVRAAGLVIEENKQRFPKQITAHKKKGAIRVQGFPDREGERKYLIESLRRIPKEQLGETAVIVRTNAQAAALVPLLRELQLPFSVKEVQKDHFRHPVALDFFSYLQFAQDMGRGGGERSDLLRIMNRPCRFLHREALRQGCLDESSWKQYYQGKPYMQEVVGTFFSQLHRLSMFRPYLGVQYIRKAMGYDCYLKEQRPEEAKHLLELADRIQKTALECDTLEEWKQYAESCRIREEAEQKERQAETSDAAGKKKHDPSGIHLITMHGSKGLEYDTVYLPSVTARHIPSPRAWSMEELEEERRLFYVAMTRAKTRLEILYHQAPSPFLLKLLSVQKQQRFPFDI